MWPSTRGGKNWPHARSTRNRPALRAHHAPGRILQAPPGEGACGRPALPVHREPADAAHTGRCGRSYRCARSIDRKSKWRVPLTDNPVWSAIMTTGGGLLFTGKETGEFIALDVDNGRAALAVPDRLRHQRAADHLHRKRPAVRDGAVRHRRPVETLPASNSRTRCPRAARVDLRAVARISRQQAKTSLGNPVPLKMSVIMAVAAALIGAAASAQEPQSPAPTPSRSRGRGAVRGELLAMPRPAHGGRRKRLRPEKISARRADALPQFGDPRQKPDAAVGRLLSSRSSSTSSGPISRTAKRIDRAGRLRRNMLMSSLPNTAAETWRHDQPFPIAWAATARRPRLQQVDEVHRRQAATAIWRPHSTSSIAGNIMDFGYKAEEILWLVESGILTLATSRRAISPIAFRS